MIGQHHPADRRRSMGMLAGAVAGALALGVGATVAGLLDTVSPMGAVGGEVIDRAPQPVREWAIRQFGTADKLVLRLGIVTVLALAALWLGAASVRRRWVGAVGIAAFGIVGAVAAAIRPGESVVAGLPSVLGAAVGAGVLWRIIGRRSERTAVETVESFDRRRFLIATGVTAAAAIAFGAAGVALDRRRIDRLRQAATRPLPASGAPAVTVPDGAQLFDTTPFITPNDDFYRIDTALGIPTIDVDTWTLTIGGMVDREVTFTYADLLARPQVERTITLCCVSNEVGGNYVGNAQWQGVMLRDLLDEAGVQAGAEQVFSTSADGWTSGFPVSAAFDGRDAMVVLGMNGETLPIDHGFPARLVVPGLYGYVSATKWLSRIDLTTWSADRGYWLEYGWASEAPVKTQSRIDVPSRGSELAAGRQAIAGVAWAQHRGIDAVQVRVDGGDWYDARLGTDVSEDAWRQWYLQWDAAPGEHIIEVRATDGLGTVQTEERTPSFPDGATGYHRIRVTVV